MLVTADSSVPRAVVDALAASDGFLGGRAVGL
jgi:hypothetical protein